MDLTPVQEYYAEVRRVEASISDPWPYVISERNVSKHTFPGVVTQVSPRIAAEQIVNQTARIATSEEIEAHISRGKDFAFRMRDAEQRRNPGKGSVILVQESGK